MALDRLAAAILALCVGSNTCPTVFRDHAGSHELAATFAASARHHDVDVSLQVGLAYAESRFHPRALSRVGAVGVLQAMPFWFARRPCRALHWRCVREQVHAGTRLARCGRFARAAVASRLPRRGSYCGSGTLCARCCAVEVGDE